MYHGKRLQTRKIMSDGAPKRLEHDGVNVDADTEHIVEELNRTPKLKRDLIMKMVEVMLDSEAFLEAYPRLYDPRIADVDLEYRERVCEEMAQIIVRLFRKNKVRPDDAEKALNRARECYLGMYVHSDKS